jgi:general stress protein CsbA
MSYVEDLAKFERLEKLRYLTLIIAFGASLASLLVDIDWLVWVDALGWLAGALVCARQAQIAKRLGRDPDATWLQAVLFGVIAAICLVAAMRHGR